MVRITILICLSLTAASGYPDTRVALVIGNDRYEALPDLNNAVRDAEAIAAMLRDHLMWDIVITDTNVDRNRMFELIDEFEAKIRLADVAFVYYSGHGMQVDGINFMIPVDADLESERDVGRDAIPTHDLLEAMKQARSRTHLVLFDACRDNPFVEDRRGFGVSAGFSALDLGRLPNVGIFFSAGENQAAYDGEGVHSPFAAELLAALEDPELELEGVVKQVTAGVIERTSNRQVPWLQQSRSIDFYFHPSTGEAAEIAYWDSVKDSSDARELEAYKEIYPRGRFVSLADLRLDRLRGGGDESDSGSPRPERFGAVLADFARRISARTGSAIRLREVRLVESETRCESRLGSYLGDRLEGPILDAMEEARRLDRAEDVESGVVAEYEVRGLIWRHGVAEIEVIVDLIGFPGNRVIGSESEVFPVELMPAGLAEQAEECEEAPVVDAARAPGDHGDDRDDASFLDTSLAGELESEDDVDYFRVMVADSTRLMIYTTGDIDTVGVLMDATRDGSGGVIAEDDDGGEGWNFQIVRALDPGTYYIAVSGYEAGRYTVHAVDVGPDDHGDTAGRPTLLTDSVNGVLETDYDYDYFEFTIVDRSTSVALYTTGEVDTVGTLSRGDARVPENVIATDDDSGSGRGFLISRVLAPGTYYVAVSGFGTGEYTIHFDHVRFDPSEVEGAEPLSGSLDGRFAAPGETHLYRIHVPPDVPGITLYTVGRVDTLGSLLEGSESGHLRVIERETGGGEWDNFWISTTVDAGDYLVSVQGTTAGEYEIHLLAPRDDHGDSPGTATLLTDALDGELTGDEDVDYFRFIVAADDPPIMFYTSGDTDTLGFLEVQRSDGSVENLAGDDDSGADLNFLMSEALAPGTYYVSVSGYGIGSYTIHSEYATGDDHGDSPEAATLLTDSISGFLEHDDDMDYFRFSVVAGDPPIALYSDANVDTLGFLVSAEDSGVHDIITYDDDSGNGNDFLISEILDPGTYYVVVSGFGQGEYTVHLKHVWYDSRDVAAAEPLQSSNGGHLEALGDVDLFRIEVAPDAPGITIYTLGSVDTVGTLLQQLEGDALREVERDDDSGEHLNFSISRTVDPGIYYVEVAGFDAGDYEIHLVAPTDDHGNDIASATVLADALEGELAIDGDVDYFQVSVESDNASVAVYTTGDIDTKAVIETRRTDGAIDTIAEDDDSGEGLNFRMAPVLEPGTYYVAVSGFEVGTYRIHFDTEMVIQAEVPEAVAESGERFRDCAECPEMVMVPAGHYLMGSPASEEERYDDEGPLHGVTIAEPLAVGVYEVTFAEWEACVRDGGCGEYMPDDEGWGRGRLPVINVNWQDAQEYVNWLSGRTGEQYRLLSESEWEYVARAGTETARYWGDTEEGQCVNANGADATAKRYQSGWTIAGCEDGYYQTSRVGSFRANGYGLHDVLGNVEEWTQDCWNGEYYGAPSDGSAWETGRCEYRVLRGGSWVSTPADMRSAFRNLEDPGIRDDATGFRVARPMAGIRFRDCAECPEMVMVPAGHYLMGSPASEEERYDDEGPLHGVTIAEPLAVGVYEVTFAEWEACVRDGGCGEYMPDDEGWGRGRLPVINVNWQDAQEYVNWLSGRTGEQYRLLSESEWEYVARAGTETARYWGDTEEGQCVNANGADATAKRYQSGWTIAGCEDGYYQTSRVGSFRANGYGLHDVLGNVEEWTQDCWNGEYYGAPSDGSAWETGRCEYRVLRGGSWVSTPADMRSAFRNLEDPGIRDDATGFRVARPGTSRGGF